jgi:tRNA nucleotidyltransferase (CCA-adding enzyme)
LNAIGQIPAGVSFAHRDAIFFCILTVGESSNQTEAMILRLALTGRQAAAVWGLAQLRRNEARLGKDGLWPSEAVALLSGTSADAIEGLALLSGNLRVRDRLRLYLDEWRYVRPLLNGRDVEALGVPHGPQVGAALDALRIARLDGAISTRDDELVLIEKFRARPPSASRKRRG